MARLFLLCSFLSCAIYGGNILRYLSNLGADDDARNSALQAELGTCASACASWEWYR
jgi:hypothetical protein